MQIRLHPEAKKLLDQTDELATQDDILEKIHRLIRRTGSQKVAAEYLNISTSTLGGTLCNGRSVGPNIAEALGYKKIPIYIKLKEEIREQVG